MRANNPRVGRSKHTPCRYLVTVDLARVARNLAREYGEPCDELAAARWLTATKGGEESPFRQLAEWAYFGCRVDPKNLLREGEILHVQDAGPPPGE